MVKLGSTVKVGARVAGWTKCIISLLDLADGPQIHLISAEAKARAELKTR